MKPGPRWIAFAALLSSPPAGAEHVSWFSEAGKTNVDSTGALMDGAYQFELGAFSAGFTPTALNLSQWRAHWVVADNAVYSASNKLFAGGFQLMDNAAPFTVGAKGWVFGYRDTSTGSEWILFRKNTWSWPLANPFNPPTIQWNAKDANEVVLGSVNASGSPFLMQSAPVRTFVQWQAGNLAGEPLSGPADDPDHDGTPNILEFVFGTPPESAGAPTSTPVVINAGHLQISVPRAPGHQAVLTVEVSSNMQQWQSGASYTQTVSETPSLLVVRDLTPLDNAHPKRFIRVRASLP